MDDLVELELHPSETVIAVPRWMANAAQEIALEAYCGPADIRETGNIAEIIQKHFETHLWVSLEGDCPQ